MGDLWVMLRARAACDDGCVRTRTTAHCDESRSLPPGRKMRWRSRTSRDITRRQCGKRDHFIRARSTFPSGVRPGEPLAAARRAGPTFEARAVARDTRPRLEERTLSVCHAV